MDRSQDLHEGGQRHPWRIGRYAALIVAVNLAMTGCQSLNPQIWRGAGTSDPGAAAPAVAAQASFGTPSAPSSGPQPVAAKAQFGAPIGAIVPAGHVVAAQAEAAPRPLPSGPPAPTPDLPHPGASAGGPGRTAAPASPIVPPTEEQVIGFGEALNIGGFENPTIALAEEQIRVSEAEWTQAKALLLPTLNAGTNVRVHQGPLQGSPGIIRNLNIQSVYVGSGALAVTAGTVEVPGVRIISPLADAVYAPQAAQQRVIARQFDAVATRNRTLLDVGNGYLAMVAAQGRLEALRRSQEDLDKVVQATANFAKAGQGRESDAQRAKTEWHLLDAQAVKATEDLAVAAADLAQLLNLDPSVRLAPADAVPPLIEIIDPAASLGDLLQIAMMNHPELGARSADIAYAEVRLKQERVRPWLPTLSMGYSAGGFGGGGSLSPIAAWLFGPRMDFDVAAIWTLQNLGAGNRARQNRASAEAGEAGAQRLRAALRIKEQVGEAFTLIRARRREMEITRKRIERAQKAFDEDLNRTRNLEGRPIEVIRSLQLLSSARVDLVRAMVGYSQAQFRLYTALGNSPSRAAAKE